MKLENKKDEENGCFLYYESSDVPENQFKRIGPRIQSYNEMGCENINYKSKKRNCRLSSWENPKLENESVQESVFYC